MPISERTAGRLVEALELPPGARVVDLGCGKGELLLAVMRRWGAAGLGVDVNAEFLRLARERASELGLAAHFEQRSLLALPAQEEDRRFTQLDAILHLGAPLLPGGWPGTLRALAARLAPGGRLIASFGYWRRAPDAEYLAHLGARLDELGSHAGNFAAGDAAGLRPVLSLESTAAEWAEYEDDYLAGIERWAAANPQDPDREAFLQRAAAWHAAHRRWGLLTLGNGFYVWRRDSA
jgi:SAM-dependent methyltransferase